MYSELGPGLRTVVRNPYFYEVLGVCRWHRHAVFMKVSYMCVGSYIQCEKLGGTL